MRHALALGRLRYQHAAKPLTEQCHPHWLVLVLVFSGQQRYLIDGAEVAVRGRELLRILPGERYGTGGLPEQKGHVAWLILSARPLRDGPALGMSAEGARAVFSLLTDSAAPRVCALPEDAAQLVGSAFAWWERRDEALGREMVRSRVAALVLGAAAALTLPRRPQTQPATDQRIRLALQWLEQHPDEMPVISELARMTRLSLTSFHAHFKRVTGCSPKDFGLRQRIEAAAARLIERPELSVTQVAHALGFSSSQYFATVFRRYFGITPTQHRGRNAPDCRPERPK